MHFGQYQGKNSGKNGKNTQNKATQGIDHPFWGTMSEDYPHEKSQIIGSGMNQVAFADIFQTAKRHPGKIATVPQRQDRGERSFCLG